MNTVELLNQVGIETRGQLLPEITGLALRADEVKEGFAFVALSGSKHNGADFVLQAFENGAVLVLAEQDVASPIPVVVTSDLRRKVSRLAALIYPSDQVLKLAVTGTNGKTSTALYVQQLLNKLYISAASIGTVGVNFGNQHWDGAMTTPDAVTLNKTLAQLQDKGVRVAVMEASSHGLDQGRLDGLTFQAGAFTNLTQDHLDYHKTMDAYREAKVKLFTDYVVPAGKAVLNADDPSFDFLKQKAQEKGLTVFSYGQNGTDLKLISQSPTADGQDIVFETNQKRYEVHVNIVGNFQAWNLMAAVGLCIGAGVAMEDLIPLLSELKAPAGRLEWMGSLPNGAQVFVDYAHTPDAVERVLTSLRAHTKGRLVCVLGCGGNRDTGKRPLMGAAAARLADVVYVTDDNPRGENPADIRRTILEACPGGIEMDNREEAIHTAIAHLHENDVLVIAGKGHEAGQTVGSVTYAMDDRIEARLAIMGQTREPLWQAADLALALSVSVPKRIKVFGFSIDTRTLVLGDVFVALKVANTDSHSRVREAVEKGAVTCLVDHLVDGVPADKQIVVSDTIEALETLCRFARMRSTATFIGVTGSSGKTTTKEMLKACLSAQGKTHATPGNYNNQIGVPLTLLTMPVDTKYAVIEMGMNHFGEMMHLSDMVRPDVTVITSIGSAHRAFFKTEQDVARAKAEIFDYQNRQGTTVLNRSGEFYDFLKEAAVAQGIQNIVTFGKSGHADFVLEQAVVDSTGTQVSFSAEQGKYTFHLNFFGEHFVEDALGALAVIQAVGGDINLAVKTLESVSPAGGRGALFIATLDGKKVAVIDDAYNANPSSMKASLISLGLRSGGRKVAVIGDMLELGDLAVEMHKGLLPAIQAAEIDKVYTVGALMKNLWDILPSNLQGGCVLNAADLIPILKNELQNGDIVLVKASHGTGLDVVIQALKGK